MARAKRQEAVVTEEKGVHLITEDFLDGFPAVQPRPLNDDLPVPQASVPGEVPAEEPPQEAPKCKVCGKAITDDDVHLKGEEPYCWDHYPMDEAPATPAEAPQAEAPAEPVTETKPPVKRELSEVLQETLQAMGYSEEYIQKVYDEKRLEAEKIEKKVNDWRGKLIAVREIIAEIEERFAFVKEAKKNLDGYVQGELGLVFDEEEPTPTDLPVEPEACAEIAEELLEHDTGVNIITGTQEGQEELSEADKALGEVIDALGGEIPEDDVPF